ncbi:MAG: hypothetical protein IH831_06595 [Planctomycetes bacterium]|nr:hypothetical protein [Planctomycetota bacterium]
MAYRREQHEQRGAEHPKTIAILRYEMVLLSSNVNVAFFMGRAIVGVLWAVRGDVMSEVLEDFFASRPMLFLSGLLALAIGIAMAISHSIWELNWRGLIMLIGYLSIAKGIARVGFPEVTQRAAGFLLKGTRNWIWISIVLVLGGYLTWVGFTRG